jgi:osmotically-inducible protein OsmY
MLRSYAVALTLTVALSSTNAFGRSDQEIQIAVQKALRAYSLVTVHFSVQKGSVTLHGVVSSCRDRLLVDETVSRIHGVRTIQDGIEVSGPRILDARLKTQIDKIIADRIRKLGGFGFGSMTVHVQDGAVTLSGAAAPELAVPAIYTIAGTVGVKNVIDHVLRVPHYEKIWRSDFPGFDGIQGAQ